MQSSVQAMHSDPSHGIQALWSRLRQWFATVREDARVRDDLEYELACLDRAGELDGVLENLGLSRAGIPVLVQNYPGAMRRFAAMTDRLGFGGAKAPTLRAGIDALFGARRRCLFCAKRRQCEAWLRSGARDGYSAFCPNAAVFDRMRNRS